MLRACWVKLKVAFLMVCFLKKYVRPYSGLLKLSIVFHRCGGYVYVNTAYGAVFMINAVNCFYTVKYIFYGIINGVLAGLYGKTLVAHVLKGRNLPCHFLLSELFTRYVLIF